MSQPAKSSKVKFLRLERVTRVGWDWAVMRDKDRGIRFLSTLNHTWGLEFYSGGNEDFLKVLK